MQQTHEPHAEVGREQHIEAEQLVARALAYLGTTRYCDTSGDWLLYLHISNCSLFEDTTLPNEWN